MISLYPQSSLGEVYGQRIKYESLGLTYEPDSAEISSDVYLTLKEPLQDLADYWLYDKVNYESVTYDIQSIEVEANIVTMRAYKTTQES